MITNIGLRPTATFFIKHSVLYTVSQKRPTFDLL